MCVTYCYRPVKTRTTVSLALGLPPRLRGSNLRSDILRELGSNGRLRSDTCDIVWSHNISRIFVGVDTRCYDNREAQGYQITTQNTEESGNVKSKIRQIIQINNIHYVHPACKWKDRQISGQFTTPTLCR